MFARIVLERVRIAEGGRRQCYDVQAMNSCATLFQSPASRLCNRSSHSNGDLLCKDFEIARWPCVGVPPYRRR